MHKKLGIGPGKEANKLSTLVEQGAGSAGINSGSTQGNILKAVQFTHTCTFRLSNSTIREKIRNFTPFNLLGY